MKPIIKNCFEKALKLNENHPDGNYRHFTFLFQCGKMLSIGMNRKAEPKIYLGYPPYSKLHSEIDAINKARHTLDISKGFEIINIRLTKGGRLRLSKPCVHCQQVLDNLGCEDVIYSVDDGFAKDLLIF